MSNVDLVRALDRERFLTDPLPLIPPETCGGKQRWNSVKDVIGRGSARGLMEVLANGKKGGTGRGRRYIGIQTSWQR